MDAPAPGGGAVARGRRAAIAVYLLYLAGFVIFPLAALGFVIALAQAGRAEAPWETHFRFQIRSALVVLAFAAAVILLMAMAAGPLRLAVNLGAGVSGIGVGIWWIGRAFVGLVKAMQDAPVRRPDSLRFGG